MTNIPPNFGAPPGPGDDQWRINESVGAFDAAVQVNLALSAHHAQEIGSTLAMLLRSPAREMQAYEIQSTVQCLYGGVLRLAACPQVPPRTIRDLGDLLGTIARNGYNLPAIERTSTQIEEILAALSRRAALLDDGASYALTHTIATTQRLQTAATTAFGAWPGPGIPRLAQETLELSQRLIDPQARAMGQDPAVALLLQGMAGSLHCIVSRMHDGPSHARLFPPLRATMDMIDDASQGTRQFATLPHTELGARVERQVTSLRDQVAGYFALRAETDLSLYALEADATSLREAVDRQMGRFGRSFLN